MPSATTTPTPTIRGLPRPLARAMEAHADRLDVAQIREAYELAVEARAGRTRASGEECVSHTVAATKTPRVHRQAPGRFALFLLAWLMLPAPLAAQASPYVLVSSSAYRDVDVLVAHRLVHGVFAGQRPYSRMTFAHAVAAARTTLAERGWGGVGSPWMGVAEALARLEVEFAPELAVLRCEGPGRCAESRVGLLPRSLSLDGMMADAPDRMTRSGIQPGQTLDAATNPLLQRNGGRVFRDGATFGLEGTFDLTLSPAVAGQVAPRVWSHSDRGSGSNVVEGTLLTGYLRAVWGKAAFDMGRTQTLWGFSPELSPVFSTNPRALTMLRVANERPGRLPWLLRHLGPASFRFGVAAMGDNRDVPGSALISMEARIQPHPNLELGLAVLNEQGGKGAPEAEWWERVVDTFGFILYRRPFHLVKDIPISNKLLGLDARFRFPHAPVELYVEFTTEDDHDLFLSPTQGAWMNAAWVWGGRALGVGPEGRFDLGVEAFHNGPIVASHFRFTSGLAVDARTLGSPVGPEASGITASLEWLGTVHSVGVAAAMERYSGDDYASPGQFDGRVRVADNPDEIRLRGVVEWGRAPAHSGFRTTLRLGAEHVARFAFGEDDRVNLMGQARLTYRW